MSLSGRRSPAGVYNLPDLPPETYRLEIEKTGFKKLIKPDVVLPVQDALEIDFEMTVGSVTESITVQGGTPAFNPAAFTAPPGLFILAYRADLSTI